MTKTTANTDTTETIHCFERAGLGKAPFKLVEIRDTSAGADSMGLVRVGETKEGFAVHTTPGGTCHLCGHALIVQCWIVSSDGKRFYVGSDCVEKTDDRGLRKVVKAKMNARRNRMRVAREKTRIDAGRAALPQVRDSLATRPHPNKWRAEQGDTLADYCDFLFTRGGHAGKLQAARIVEKELKG